MCKILTPKEKESLNKLTRLVESLTKKKVILESKPDCHCCDKKSLKENTHNFKRYSVYELMHGQPARFWNEVQNNFTYEVKNATLYTKEEAEALANKLLQPRIKKYQKDGEHYSELHTGDLFKKRMLKESLMSGASEETKSRDVEESDKEHIETKQKRNKLAQEKYKKDYKELGEEQKNIVNKKLHESKQNLKEGVWALPKDAVARRKAMNFKQELQRIKNDIYDIAGSDELFDRLDGAITELDNLITAGKSQGNV